MSPESQSVIPWILSGWFAFCVAGQQIIEQFSRRLDMSPDPKKIEPKPAAPKTLEPPTQPPGVPPKTITPTKPDPRPPGPGDGYLG